MYLAYLGDTKKVIIIFLIIKVGEMEMQIKLPPVHGNMLCKSHYCICHICCW